MTDVGATPAATRLWLRPRRTRLYAADRSHPRARRPTDLLLLGLSGAGLVAIGQIAEPPTDFERALIALVDAIPDAFEVVWRVSAGGLSVWALLLVLGALLRWRLDVVRDQVLGILITVGAIGVAEELAAPRTKSLWSAAVSAEPPADPVSARLAFVTVLLVVASPHLSRPFRSTSRWLLSGGAVSLVLLGATTVTGALLGLLAGATAAAVVHLVFGSSAGRPSLGDVARGLEELGVSAVSLSSAARQRAGSWVLDGVDSSGRHLVVRVYGRDAWDSQLLAKAWRSLWYRDAGSLTLTRLQQAEHEGFVTLLAARNGVPVHHVVSAGRTGANDALIVLQTRGAPLPDRVDDAVIDAVWDSVLALGAAGLAHGDLGPERFRCDGAEIVLGGFAGVTVAPSEDQRRVDLAQALVSTSVLAGSEAAVTVALRRLGVDGLTTMLPYVQRAALGPTVRDALDRSGVDLDDLRSSAADAAGVDGPELAPLRRVSTASLVRAALLAAAGYFFISTLAGVDLDELAEVLGDASLGVLVVALLWGQVPRLSQAEATRAACPRPIPFGPVALLQLAISFVNLAIPSTAARVAVSIRFFQRQGIPPASAVSIGVIDSVGGFVVQVFVLVSVLALGFGDVELDIERPGDLGSGTLLRLLGVVIVTAIFLLVAAMLVPRARARVLDFVRPWVHEVGQTVSTLRSPRRVARILGANAATEVLFATTLGIVVASFGGSLNLATLLVINVSVALFSGLMPVPGGIGVAEGALVVGLTAAGLDEAVAFGAAIAYRICTFYLPPLWGAVAYRRLERNGLL